MTISREYWVKNLTQLANKSHNYMVLDTEHLGYSDDEERFRQGILALDVCNTIAWANDLYRKLNINKRFNDAIIFDVMKSLYTGKPFTDKQLQEYYKFQQQFHEFEHHMKRFYAHIESMTIGSETEFVLLGLNWEEQEELGSTTVKDLNSRYIGLFVQFLDKEIIMDNFITQAKELIEDVKNPPLNKDRDAA